MVHLEFSMRLQLHMIKKSKKTRITSRRNVISNDHMVSAVFIASWLVLPLRERKNSMQFS